MVELLPPCQHRPWLASASFSRSLMFQTECGGGRTGSSGPASAEPEHASGHDMTKASSPLLRCLTPNAEKTRRDRRCQTLRVRRGGGACRASRVSCILQLFLKTAAVAVVLAGRPHAAFLGGPGLLASGPPYLL